MVQNTLEKPSIRLPESLNACDAAQEKTIPNDEQATTLAKPATINLPSLDLLEIASSNTPITQLQKEALTDLGKWSQSVELTDIVKSASQALQKRYVPFYQPDLFADKKTVCPNSKLIQICDRVAYDLVPVQRLVLASYWDSSAASVDKMASKFKELTGREEDLSILNCGLQDAFKDAGIIFNAWATREGFSLTVFKTWMDLVQHGSRKNKNKSQPDYAPYLGKFVYPFTKAILMEPHFPIVGAQTKLWVRWYGHHASMAHIWLKMLLQNEPKAGDNQALIQALTILYIYLEVHNHADATVHAVFRQATKIPEEHLSRLKRAFYEGLARISDSQLLDEPSRESLDKMKNFAEELKFKDDEISHSGIMKEMMAHLDKLLK